MNRGELRSYLRRKLQDERPDYLWPDEEMDDAIQDSQCEVGRRTRLLFEKGTALTTFDTVDGDESYAISRLFFDVTRVLVNGRQIPKVTREDVELERCVTPAKGVPCAWFMGNDGRLYFDKAANGVFQIKFEGYRFPKALADDDAECELPDDTGSVHRKMLLWAMKLLKEKEDLETERQGDAARHEAAFDREFGPAVNVAARVSQAQSGRRQTRANWF